MKEKTSGKSTPPKKSKETSTKQTKSGTSDPVVNDVGSQMLHERHKIRLEKEEGEPIARAKVTDQLVIDRLLNDDLISLSQHKAAEIFLLTAKNAGIFLTGPNMMGSPSGSAKKEKYHFGLLRFGRMLSMVSEEIGQRGADLLMIVTCEEHEPNEEQLEIYKKALDVIVESRGIAYE